MVQAATAEIHKRAERRPFMAAYLRGHLGREPYAGYLAALVPVYQALAETTPSDSFFAQPGLDRLEPLLADVTSLQVPETDLDSSHAYAQRVRSVAGTPAWVSHHWLRTLGYLMGQDMLRELTVRNLGSDAPVAFYAFPAFEDRRRVADGYHAAFDAITTDPEERLAVIDEAYRAFSMQIALTDELAERFALPAI